MYFIGSEDENEVKKLFISQNICLKKTQTLKMNTKTTFVIITDKIENYLKALKTRSYIFI